MKIEVGKIYVDREGVRWRIHSINPMLPSPVRAFRMGANGVILSKRRIFKGDGHYFPTGDDPWDLIKEAE